MAEKDYSFVIADVFTRRPFGGNQLAVLPDARCLSDAAMQALAREFNFSETTFVLPPDDPAADPARTRRVRIFTPRVELPFAGHPTVGTASVLARGGHVDVAASGGQLILEEGVGPVTVDVDGTYSRFTVNNPFETPGRPPPVEAVAAALSLPTGDVVDCWYASVGVRFCYVQLSSTDAVDRAALDRAAWSAGMADCWSPDLYMFAGGFRSGGRLYARAFVPSMGVEEDPATGSACAGLIASLAQRSIDAGVGAHHASGLAPGRTTGTAGGGDADGGDGGGADDGGAEGGGPQARDARRVELHVDQGVAMGRPSQIEASALTRGGRLAGVRIGGHTVIVASGTMTVPEPSPPKDLRD